MPTQSLIPLAAALAAPFLLSGCGGEAAVMQGGMSQLVAAQGDDEADAVAEAQERATEACEARDYERFEILDQQLLRPGEDNAAAMALLQGATVAEDADLGGFIDGDSDEYRLIWRIACR
jgi:hypothetical protein